MHHVIAELVVVFTQLEERISTHDHECCVFECASIREPFRLREQRGPADDTALRDRAHRQVLLPWYHQFDRNAALDDATKNVRWSLLLLDDRSSRLAFEPRDRRDSFEALIIQFREYPNFSEAFFGRRRYQSLGFVCTHDLLLPGTCSTTSKGGKMAEEKVLRSKLGEIHS